MWWLRATVLLAAALGSEAFAVSQSNPVTCTRAAVRPQWASAAVCGGFVQSAHLHHGAQQRRQADRCRADSKQSHVVMNLARQGMQAATQNNKRVLATFVTSTAAFAAVGGGVLAGGLHAISGPDHLAALLPRIMGKPWSTSMRYDICIFVYIYIHTYVRINPYSHLPCFTHAIRLSLMYRTPTGLVQCGV
jgi:hypothetical protein